MILFTWKEWIKYKKTSKYIDVEDYIKINTINQNKRKLLEKLCKFQANGNKNMKITII
jgi:hypothetical protein